MLMSGAMVDKKKGVLELTKLEYPKKWYFPTYFANSVFGPNISTIDANGPFWPLKVWVFCLQISSAGERNYEYLRKIERTAN